MGFLEPGKGCGSVFELVSFPAVLLWWNDATLVALVVAIVGPTTLEKLAAGAAEVDPAWTGAAVGLPVLLEPGSLIKDALRSVVCIPSEAVVKSLWVQGKGEVRSEKAGDPWDESTGSCLGPPGLVDGL